jgi:hypothetical protein
MTELLNTIVLWISINLAIPAVYDHPRIEYVPTAKMISMRLRGMPTVAQETLLPSQIPDVVAIYDDEKRTIFLPEGWTGKTPADLSVLVHEMVHHLQNIDGQKFECPAAREKPAYLAQDKWLKQFDQTLEKEFEVDLFTIVVKSACII